MGSHGLLIVDHGQSVGTHDGYHPRDLRGEAMGHPMSCLPQLSRHGSSRSKLAAVFFAEKGKGKKMESVNAQHILVDSGLFFYLVHSKCFSLRLDFTEQFQNHKLHFLIWILQIFSKNLQPARWKRNEKICSPQNWDTKMRAIRTKPSRSKPQVPLFFFRMRQPSQILS